MALTGLVNITSNTDLHLQHRAREAGKMSVSAPKLISGRFILKRIGANRFQVTG